MDRRGGRTIAAGLLVAMATLATVVSASAEDGPARLAEAERYAKDEPHDLVGLRDLYLGIVRDEPEGSPAYRTALERVEALERRLPEAYARLARQVPGEHDFSDTECRRFGRELTRDLRRPHAVVRRRAVEYLRHLRCATTIGALVEALAVEENLATLRRIREALAVLPADLVARKLTTLRGSRNLEAQVRALEILEHFAGADGDVWRVASEALGFFVGSRFDTVADAALCILEDLDARGLPGLVEATAVKDHGLRVRIIRALGATGEGEAAAVLGQYLVLGIKGPGRELKAEALQAIESLGWNAVPHLIPWVDDPRRRQWTKAVLHRITGRSFEYSEQVRSWWRQQREAKRERDPADEPGAAPPDPLERLPDSVERLREIARSYEKDHPEERVGLRDVYRKLRTLEKPGTPMAEWAEEHVRWLEAELAEAYVALAGKRPGELRLEAGRERRFLRELVADLRNRDPLVRLRAAQYLERLDSEAAAPYLAKALVKEEDGRVAAALIAALERRPGAEVAELLARHVAPRGTALARREALLLLRGLLRREDEETGRAASKALGAFALGSRESTIEEALTLLENAGQVGLWGLHEAIAIRDHRFRLRVIKALGATGDGRAADGLARLLLFGSKGDAHVQKMAALDAIRDLGRVAVPWLARFVDLPRHRQWTIFILREITGVEFETSHAVRAWCSRRPELRDNR
jgi:HEAT repeat protein